jgi:hypothetical protein
VLYGILHSKGYVGLLCNEVVRINIPKLAKGIAAIYTPILLLNLYEHYSSTMCYESGDG